jgi:uncharacterized tellurite resistance protein B-like protein
MAWADGTVEDDERNRIKVLLNRFEIEPADRRDVEALLDRPVSFDEALALTKDFAGRLAPPGARKRLVAELEAMTGGASSRTPEETALLEHVTAILSSHTVVDGLAEKLRGLFRGSLFRAGPQDGEVETRDPQETFLEAVSRKKSDGGIDLQRTCAEYSRRSTMDERLDAVDRLFERAADDGVITKDEAERIRRIADLLWVSNPEYLAVRDRHRDRIET